MFMIALTEEGGRVPAVQALYESRDEAAQDLPLIADALNRSADTLHVVATDHVGHFWVC